MTHDPDAPPAAGPTVEMPKPTVWPMVLSVGLTLAAAGVTLGPAFLLIGLGLFGLALVKWLGELLPGQGHEHEPITAVPDPVAPRPGTVEQLVPGAVGYRFRVPEKIHPVSAGLKGGLVGGVVMTLPALAWGLLTGHGVWFPVNLLAGTLLPGVDTMPVADLEKFSPVLLAIGVVMHAAMSATIGLAYGVLLPTMPGTDRGHLIAGGLVLPLLWTGTSYGLMGVVNPVLQRYVDWHWFAASQFVFGLAAAFVVIRSEKLIVPPAGSGSPPDRPAGPVHALLMLLAVLPLAGGCGPLPGKPNPANAEKAPDAVLDFDTLYSNNCAGCHGQNGSAGPAPPPADPLFLAIVPDAELLKVITDGRRGTPMPAFAHSKGGPLTEEQVGKLAAGLKKKWAKPDTAPANTPPYLASAGAASDAGRGQAAFARACAGCHGDHGQGGKAGAINAPAYLALTSDQTLRRIVITGRPDLGCPRFDEKTGRPADIQPLSGQDVSDIVTLLASWRKSGLK